MGAEARSSVPSILELMDSETVGLRYAAAYALGEIGGGEEVVEALEKSIQSDDLFLRTVSAWALNRLKPKDEAVTRQTASIILEALKSERKDAIAMATQALAELEEVPDDVRDALVDAVDHSDPQVVEQVIQAMAAAGENVLPRVERALGRKNIRGYAVRVMQRLGEKAAPAVPELVEILKTEDVEPEFREEAHFALGAIGPKAAPAVPVLIEALSHKVPEVRYSACYALGQIGPPASAATPALKANMRVQDSFLRLGSIWALLKINPNDPEIGRAVAPLLAEALDDPRPHIRAEAARSLGEVGSYAKRYEAKLRAALNDESTEVREAAKATLDKISG
jgi:HEAT repeat protein